MSLTGDMVSAGQPDPLFELRIETRLDVALAYRQAVTAVKLLDFQIVDQTKVGTSVSEVLRFMVAHFRDVWMNIRLLTSEQDKKCHFVEINISGAFGKGDEGQKESEKIADMRKMSEINTASVLMDEMSISAEDHHALLVLRKKCVLETLTSEHWKKIREELSNKAGGQVTPYQELKDKNQQLEALTLELEKKNGAINKQLRQIKKLNKELDDKNESLTEFAYTLSHDLKNPLSTLTLLVQLGKMSEDKDEIFQQFGPVIENMNQIVAGLIRIIDVDQDASSGVRTIRFREEFDNLLTEYRHQLQEEDGIIELELGVEDIDYVEAYLASIVRNLVSNAIKYRHPGRKAFIRLSTHFEDPYVVLKVQDNGIGMNLEHTRHKMFKPFQRFTTRQSGKGIGLHLIKKMIEKNQGKMEVDSKEGEGTTFTCFLMPYVV